MMGQERGFGPKTQSTSRIGDICDKSKKSQWKSMETKKYMSSVFQSDQVEWERVFGEDEFGPVSEKYMI